DARAFGGYEPAIGRPLDANRSDPDHDASAVQATVQQTEAFRLLDDVALKRSSPSDRAPTRFELDLCHIVTDGGREPMACGIFVNLASQAKKSPQNRGRT